MDRVSQLLQSGIIALIALIVVGGYVVQVTVTRTPVDEGYYAVLFACLAAVGVGRAGTAILNRTTEPASQDPAVTQHAADFTPIIRAIGTVEDRLDSLDLLAAARAALAEERAQQVEQNAPLKLVPGNI